VRDTVLQVEGPMIWGLSPAPSGDDRTVLIKRRMNIVPEVPSVWYKLDEIGIVGRVKEVWDATKQKDRPTYIYVDSVLFGAGIVNRLRKLGLPAIGINVAEHPSIRWGGKYKNMRTENWFRMREFFETRTSRIAPDDDLIEELSSQPYKVLENTGATLATPKEDVKKILGRQPTAGEALMLTFSHNAGFTMTEGGDWDKPLKRYIRGIV
jgi:hypothetical protein